MQCTNPVTLVKQGLQVPCGKCMACRISRAREWTTRILHEMDYWESATFATFTYNEAHLPDDRALDKRCLQRYFKRLRKDLAPRKIKYFAAGEYGDKNRRPHYHAILFGLDPVQDKDYIDDNWPYGFTYLGYVSYDSARYVADYVQKKYSGKMEDYYDGRPQPFSLVSAGLGRRYAEDNSDQLNEQMSVTIRGVPVGLPRYYRKVLEMDPEQLAVRAKDKKKELNDYYIEKLGSLNACIGLSDARKQHSRNLAAQNALHRKGKL